MPLIYILLDGVAATRKSTALPKVSIFRVILVKVIAWSLLISVVKDKVEKWEDLLNELNESSSTHGATEKVGVSEAHAFVSNRCLQLSGTAPIDQIQTDTWLEVQNDHNPHTVWLAKVIQNVGGRLRLQHAGELATFWLFYLNCRLHPIGWAAELEYQLEPPPSEFVYKSMDCFL